MKLKIKLTIFILILLFLNGCKNILPNNKIKQGVAIFSIKYETTKEENPIVILLPNKMYTYFQDNKLSTVVEGFFGTFRMVMLNRPDLNKKYTIIKVLDKKYIYETDINGIPYSSSEMKNLKITFLDTSFNYKNFNVKIAAVSCPSIKKDTFWVYYTTDVNIKYGNSNSPYYKIPGVLLKFKLRLLGITFDVNFDKIEKEKFDPSILEVPKENYQYVDLDQLQHILKSFL